MSHSRFSVPDFYPPVKWAAFVIAWCTVCGLVIGFIGNQTDGIGRAIFVLARALLVVALLQETVRSKSSWKPLIAKLLYTALITVCMFGISRVVGDWSWSLIGGGVGIVCGGLIGGGVAVIGWFFDECETIDS